MKNKLLNYIQFLRGISVLLVFFYHLKINNFEYGYLGVDIFFVISGFVITSRIFHEYKTVNNFSFLNFYLRRVKRIYPVLIFILSLVLLLIILFQPLDLFIENLSVFSYSLLGLSNLYYLFSRKDYFDTVFDDPYAHTWSLGAEEQFYVFFPIFFLFILNISKNIKKNIYYISFFILLGIILTFLFKDNHKLVFYSPIFRFWEFLIGSITFLISIKIKFKNNFISLIMLFFLFILILFVEAINPITLILITTILSSTFILTYKKNKKKFINYIIENKLFIFIGNISYSFYLWHLPIIYFYDLYFLDNLFRVPVLFLIITILSFFSFNFVEEKFRYIDFKKNLNFKKIVIITSALIFFIGSVNFFVMKDSNQSIIKKNLKKFVYNFNYLERNLNFTERTVFYKFNINNNQIYRFCSESSNSIKLNSDNLRKHCLKHGKNKFRIFYLEGDSHTANFVPMLNSLEIDDSIYVSIKSLDDINFELINNLTKSYNEVIFTTHIGHIDGLNKLIKIKKNFNSKIKILILGPIPNVDININPLKCFIKDKNCIYKKSNDLNLRNIKILINKIKNLMQKDKAFLFFYPYNSICPNENCYVFDKEKDLLTHRDDGHLTIEGSMLIKDKFYEYYNKIK